MTESLESNDILPLKRITFVDIIPYKWFIVFIGIILVGFFGIKLSSLSVFPEKSSVLFIEIVIATILFYYLNYFLEHYFYPRWFRTVNISPLDRLTFDRTLFNAKNLVFAMVTFSVPLGLIIYVGIEIMLQFFSQPIEFCFIIILAIPLIGATISGYIYGFCGVVQAVRFRNRLQFTISHEDQMGGHRKTLELYFKNVYPFFLIIPLDITVMYQILMDQTDLFQINNQQLILALLIMMILIILMAVFYYQIILIFRMRQYKQGEIPVLNQKVNDLLLILKKPGLDLESQNHMLIDIITLQHEQHYVMSMKSILFNSTLSTKLLVSLFGIIISYTANLILDYRF